MASTYCSDVELSRRVLDIPIHTTSSNRKNDVISVLQIIKAIQEREGNILIKILGDSEILVNIDNEKKTNKILQNIKILIVCMTLFLGAGLAIINFHQDINMEESLSIFYRIVTGDESDRPLILQIPYSFGIGIGMITFFNHVLKKKWKKEPSPLDVEMYMYDKNINEYVLDSTKQNNKSKRS